jgi:hypothetical protein
MPRLSCGLHDLADKTLGSCRASTSVADAARTNSQIVGWTLHDCKTEVSRKEMAVDALILLVL